MGRHLAKGRGPSFPIVALYLLTNDLCQLDERLGIQQQRLAFTLEAAV